MTDAPNPKKKIVLQAQAGFTLIELMVVVVIVGILATMGAPAINRYILQANLESAIPYLQAIAGKQRIYYNRNGEYVDSASESAIQTKLGVSLKESGDFCYIVCRNATGCGLSIDDTTVTYGSGSGVINFEVHAILRNTETVDVTSMKTGKTCTPITPANGKTAPSGWVRDTTTDASGAIVSTRGSHGRTIVLRSPAPTDDINWRQGVYFSNANQD